MKQNLNKIFKDYVDKNQLTEEDTEMLANLKEDIYKILDAESVVDAKIVRDKLIDNKCPKNNFIDKILWKFVIPNFNKLIIPIENSIILSTNNKIENIFQKIFFQNILKEE